MIECLGEPEVEVNPCHFPSFINTHTLPVPLSAGVVNEQGLSSPFGSRVAQLRMNFNTPNTKVPSPCTKPPIPTKPAHLLTAASVR